MIVQLSLNFPALTLMTSILNNVDYRYGNDTVATLVVQETNMRSPNLDLPLTFTENQTFDSN